MLKTLAIIKDQPANVGDPGLAVGCTDQSPNRGLGRSFSMQLLAHVAKKHISEAERKGLARLCRELRLTVGGDSAGLDHNFPLGKLV